jgi:hypothetical protein
MRAHKTKPHASTLVPKIHKEIRRVARIRIKDKDKNGAKGGTRTPWVAQPDPKGNAGARAFAIHAFAGHSSVVISQRYVHSDREAKESAINLLDVLNQPKIKS